MIKSATNELIGAEIMDIEKNKCVIRIFSSTEEEFDKYLIKMVLTIKQMLRIIEESGKSNTILELRNANWRIRDYLLRNAFMQNIPYENTSVLNTILHSLEKIGGNLLIYYRDCKKKTKSDLSDVKKMLDWFVSSLGKNAAIDYKEELAFRKRLNKYNKKLLNNKQSALNTIMYFTVELLEGTVSYVSTYKNNSIFNT